MNVEIKAATRRYHVGFEQDKSKPQTVTECKIFLLTASSGSTLVGRGVTTLGKNDKADSMVACKIALTRALDDAKLGKEVNTTFWKEFQLHHIRLICRLICRETFSEILKRLPAAKFNNIGGTFDEYRKKLIDAGGCQHKLVAKGSGLDWCTKHSYACTPLSDCRLRLGGGGSKAVPHGYGGLHSHRKRSRQAKDRCHRNTFSDAARIRDIVGRVDEKHQQWLHGISHDELEPRPSWLRRVGRAVARWWNETDMDRLTCAEAEVKKEDEGRDMFDAISKNYCYGCHGKTIWLRGLKNEVQCKYCRQRYLLDPATRTAKQI